MSAKDLGTGTEQSIKIESQTSLTEDEINAKVAEAEEFASEDKRRKAGVTLINSADGMVYQATKMLNEADRENLRLECRANPRQARGIEGLDYKGRQDDRCRRFGRGSCAG